MSIPTPRFGCALCFHFRPRGSRCFYDVGHPEPCSADEDAEFCPHHLPATGSCKQTGGKTSMDRKKHWSHELRAMGACEEALKWARKQPSFAAAWRKCEKGDWMLWLVSRLCRQGNALHIACVRSAVAIADTVLHLVTSRKTYPDVALWLALFWCEDPSVEVPGTAFALAYDAGYHSHAASAASSILSSTYDVGWVVNTMTDATDAVWFAKYSRRNSLGEADAACDALLAQAADIVRHYIPKAPELKPRRESP